MHVSHRFISAVLSWTFSCIFQFSVFLQKAVGRRRSRSAESSNTRGRTRQEGWAFPSLRRTDEDSKRIPSFLFSCLLFLKSLRPLCCCLSLLSLMCQYAHMLQLLPLFFFHKLNLSLFLSLSLCRDGLSGTSFAHNEWSRDKCSASLSTRVRCVSVTITSPGSNQNKMLPLHLATRTHRAMCA